MKRESIFLAALLHDIGKFWQLSEENGDITSSSLFTSIKEYQESCCPKVNGRYVQQQVLWTAAFLNKYKVFLANVLGEGEFEPFVRAASCHHSRDNKDLYQYIIYLSKLYSVGSSQELSIISSSEDSDLNAMRSMRVSSIFEGLANDKASGKYSIRLNPLLVDHSFFPVDSKGDVIDESTYATLWKQFEASFSDLVHIGGNGLIVGDNISFLLHRYACTVPYNAKLPDVPLYDHLKSVGTMALCLYDYLAYYDRLSIPINIRNDEAPFLLVGGDLSGIQKYIYDIVSTDAARNLKGRSFYLQILVDNAIEVILRELALPRGAIVYASGGGFYLLAPNTPTVVSKLQDVCKDLALSLFESHQTNLSLNIAWQEVSQEQMQEQRIDLAWKGLSSKIGQMKAQKFKDRIIADYSTFFKPTDIGGKQVLDFITGEEFTEREAEDIKSNNGSKSVMLIDGELNKPVKFATYKQIELGKNLRRTDYWITTTTAITDTEWHKYEFSIPGLTIYNYLLPKDALTRRNIVLPKQSFIRTLNAELQDFQKSISLMPAQDSVYGFVFYGGNDFPEKDDGSPVTFDEMASNGQGAQKLGILRMDVDGLGAIFISGLANKGLTFSRYSVLSRSLDYFFKGFLNKIWRQHFDKSCTIIYSGGDDLFIAGHWAATIDFAQKIQAEFNSWVCYNSLISISGGIALTGGKFPVSKGAELSADAEKLAKEHKANGIEKNAITLFNVPLNWDVEFPMVQQLKCQMVHLIKTERALPRGLLQKLMVYAEKAKEQAKENKNQSWRWHLAYDFSRAAKHNEQQSARAFYDNLKTAAFSEKWEGKSIPEVFEGGNRRTFLDLLGVAARWAELETK